MLMTNKQYEIMKTKSEDENKSIKHSIKHTNNQDNNSYSNDENNFFIKIDNKLDNVSQLSYSESNTDELQKIKHDIENLKSNFNKINLELNNLTKKMALFFNKTNMNINHLDDTTNRIQSSDEYSLDKNDMICYSNSENN